VKTSDAALGRLVARIAALHPYSVPEIVALDVRFSEREVPRVGGLGDVRVKIPVSAIERNPSLVTM